MATKIAVSFEIGHKAVLKSKKSHDNFTHNWELYVRGIDGKDISAYIEKIVFNLHESFPKPKRTFKEPPYVLKESGYAGFIVLVDIHFKNRQVQHCNYDLVLSHTGPPVYSSEVKRFVFDNPSEEFKQKLLKGGGVYEGNEEKSKDLDDFNKPKQSNNDNQPSKKHKNKTDKSKLQPNFHNVFGLPITKNSPSTTPNVSSAKPIVDNSNKILSKTNVTSVPSGSSSTKSTSSSKSDKHLSSTKEKSDRKEKHSKHSSSPHKDKVSSSSSSKNNIKKDVAKREERKKDKNHSKERDRSREKNIITNLPKRPSSPSPVPGLKHGPSPLSKKSSISPARSSSVTSNKEIKTKNISITSNTTDDRKSQSSSKKSKKEKKSHEKEKDRSREDRKEKEKFKSTSESHPNKSRDSESSRVSNASSNLQTPAEQIKDHKSKDSGTSTKTSTSKKVDEKNSQISTPDSIKSKSEKHHDKTDEKHKHKHKKKDKTKDRESSKDLLKDKKKEKNLKSEVDLNNKAKDNVAETNTAQKLTQKSITNIISLSQTNISPKLATNVVAANVEPPLSDSDSDSEIPTRSTSTVTAEKLIQQSDSSNISYQDVKNPIVPADQKERKKETKNVEKQEEKKRKRKNRDSSVDSEKKSPKLSSQSLEPIVKMPRKSNSSTDLKPTSVESSISNTTNDVNSNCNLGNNNNNNNNNNIDNDNNNNSNNISSSSNNNNNNNNSNNNNSNNNDSNINNSNINNNNNNSNINNNSNSTPNNITDNDNNNNTNNNDDNTNNNILSYSRNSNNIDYMSELRDLQKKIMTLQDNSELQQVVELIAATGRYEITSKTFDFDLCALDRHTVERLQAFFASAPTTSVS